MRRSWCLTLLALVIAYGEAGCAHLKDVTSDGSSVGVPKQAQLVAESARTVGIFEAQSDGTLYIVRSDPSHNRPDVLAFSGPIAEGQKLTIDTTPAAEAKEATIDGKSLGLKLGEDSGEVLYRVFFIDRNAAATLGMQ
jgi:hypothetical protein